MNLYGFVIIIVVADEGGIRLKRNGCMKCGSTQAGTKEIATTGTGLSKIFDVQHNQFIVVYCKKCGYSEFYNKESSKLSNVVDLFFGG